MEQTQILQEDRGVMKVYAAREYRDDKFRMTNFVKVNIPEYVPTVPQDAETEKAPLTSNYFVNKNFPATGDHVKSIHCLNLPLLEGTRCPIQFYKGAEFLLHYPTGKIEEGFLTFIRDQKYLEKVKELPPGEDDDDDE